MILHLVCETQYHGYALYPPVGSPVITHMMIPGQTCCWIIGSKICASWLELVQLLLVQAHDWCQPSQMPTSHVLVHDLYGTANNWFGYPICQPLVYKDSSIWTIMPGPPSMSGESSLPSLQLHTSLKYWYAWITVFFDTLASFAASITGYWRHHQ
jgi:hypothetical protein